MLLSIICVRLQNYWDEGKIYEHAQSDDENMNDFPAHISYPYVHRQSAYKNDSPLLRVKNY